MTTQPENRKKILAHFKKNDQIIYRVLKEVDLHEWLAPRERTRATSSYFYALCREIIGQQLSEKVADVIIKRFRGLFPPLRRINSRATITPQAILGFKDEELRGVGMSWAKVSFLKDLAHKSAHKEIQLAALSKLSDEEVVNTLTRVKGIGPWTAEMFLMFTLGRENVFSYGDLALHKAIARLYNIKTPSQAQKARIVEKWSPYKSYGSFALWASVDKK